MEVWQKVNEPIYTPGGDPAWECPVCGYRHVYGVENANESLHKCLGCFVEIRYPWEREENHCASNDQY